MTVINDINMTLVARLAEQCEKNKPDEVDLLLKKCLEQDPSGISINACVVSSSTGRRETALHICARTDAWMCAKHLMESGRCDMLLWNDQGKTPLRVARDCKSEQMIKLLENFALDRLSAQGGIYNQQVETPLLVPLPHVYQLRGLGSSSSGISKTVKAPAAALDAPSATPSMPVHSEKS